MSEKVSRETRPRVLLIGWDAADWEMIDPLMEKGLMPNLKAFLEKGVRGDVATLLPILSPILWNSIATGKTADKHDILGFLEPDGKGGIRPVSSTSRKCKAIWNIASQEGLRACVVGWFASHPAERINGAVVTDRFRVSFGKRAEEHPIDDRTVYPASLIEPLSDLIVEPNDIMGEQILPFIPRATEIDHTKDQRLGAFAQVMAECATIHNAATWLAEHEQWDLLAVYYDAIDHFGHGFMEYHPPKMPHVSDRDFEIFGDVMNRVVEFHDMMLGRLLQLIDDDTTVIILSDHGFLNDERRPAIYYDQKTAKKVGPGMNPVAWHRPFGIVAMRGPGIKQGATITGASLLDIAPTVLAALGLPIPADMDGKPLVQAFETAPTLKTVDSYEAPHPDDGMHRGEVEEDPWAAAEVVKQLAALGYIENPGDDQAKAVERTVLDRKANLAQVHFSSGRNREAAAALTELLEAQPEAANIRARLVMCLLVMQRFDQAEKWLDGYGRDAAKEPMLSILRSQLLFHQEKPEEAMDLLRQVRQLHPKLPLVHLYIGNALMRARNWEEAEQSYRAVLEIDPEDAEANDRLGVVLRRQGKFDDAVYYHMKSASLIHHRPVTHINLGLSLTALGQIDWAIEAFKVAISMAPRSAFAHRMLGFLYARQRKDPELARFHRHRAAELRKESNRARMGAALEEGSWSG